MLERALLLQQLVYPGGADEIILTQAVDGVRGEIDFTEVVAG
jgi:hypothetical protein